MCVVVQCATIWRTFRCKLENLIKKTHPKKFPYMSRNRTFLALILKSFLYFLTYRKRNLRKKLFIFQETETLKKFLIFQDMELSSPTSKNFLYLRKQKTRKNILHFLKRKLFLYFWKRKRRRNSLYLKKQNFLIFQETSYISGSDF